MLMLLSPAKSLHEGPADAALAATTPALQAETEGLLPTLRSMSAPELEALMSISPKLGELNAERYRAMQFPSTRQNARQAALLFAGDTYRGLDAATLSTEDLAWAQERVGILSGLYGVLRPLDLAQPYRLEMGTRLETDRGTGLYAYWGDRIATALSEWQGADDVVINCASNEYFSAVGPHLHGTVITPSFKDIKGGKARMISYFAKQARGAMVRWAIEQRVTDPEALKGCDAMGYTFRPELSTPTRWEFHRIQPPPVGKR